MQPLCSQVDHGEAVFRKGHIVLSKTKKKCVYISCMYVYISILFLVAYILFSKPVLLS